MTSGARTVAEYLQSLPAERRTTLSAVREVIRASLPEGYEEGMQYGMIGYYVPHRLYPAGYHCRREEPLPYAALGSQKNYMVIHLMAVYGDKATEQWFRQAWKASGKKLDMGKACVRFRKLDDLPLEVIGQVVGRVPVQRYIARVEEAQSQTARRRRG